MDVTISSLKFNLLTAVGMLSSQKLARLDVILGPMFPNKQQLPDLALLYIDPLKRSSTIINPNQIGFGIDGLEFLPIATGTDSLSSIMADWKRQATEIFNTLLMDPGSSGFVISIVGVVPTVGSKPTAAAEHFIQKFSPIHHQELKKIVDITSVGLRYLFSKEGLTYDCHVEPLLSNLNTYFLDMNITAPHGHYEMESVFNALSTALAFFKNEWFTTVKDSMLI